MNVAHKMTNNDKSDHGVFGGGQPIQLGRPMRQFFQFDDDYVNLNHGASTICLQDLQFVTSAKTTPQAHSGHVPYQYRRDCGPTKHKPRPAPTSSSGMICHV